jgi:hypothetical protein
LDTTFFYLNVMGIKENPYCQFFKLLWWYKYGIHHTSAKALSCFTYLWFIAITSQSDKGRDTGKRRLLSARSIGGWKAACGVCLMPSLQRLLKGFGLNKDPKSRSAHVILVLYNN